MAAKLKRVKSDSKDQDHFTVPKHKQLAALCYRNGKKGREILLVTSSRGRWILPKGWPMKGRHDGEAAMIEAWEEGGVKRGKLSKKPLGKYLGTKISKSGDEEVAETRVYKVKVTDTRKRYPERKRRDRQWVTAKEAARLVTEDGLRKIIKAFGKS